MVYKGPGTPEAFLWILGREACSRGTTMSTGLFCVTLLQKEAREKALFLVLCH